MVIGKTGDVSDFNEILSKAVQAPFNKKLDIKIINVQKGSVELELDTNRDLANGLGIVHGGVTASLCDSAMGFAAMTLGVFPVTVEMKLNFLSPGSIGDRLIAKGKIIKEGKTLIIADGEVYSGNKLIAKSLGTYFAQKTKSDIPSQDIN
ncbi:MAG: PaaI family thioesterase [Thermoanaerobacteraceae bacterium]|nr:PaaI family thioesterase [Thermoanaerobacteraceae bacterium]